jgi:hypothetical protein
MEPRKLTKKEVKALRKQERLQKETGQVTRQIKWQWFIIGLVATGVLGVVGLVIYAANRPQKPLPGTAVTQLGREHITDIAGIRYTSNPPTSGDHFNAWAKRGVYPNILSDGYLLHSLEHGYIVISYNCGSLAKPQKNLTYKKGAALTTTPVDQNALMAPFTPENMPKDTKALSKEFDSQSCKSLVKNLSTFLDEFPRIVIVPRTNLDKPVVLTAWGWIQKFSGYDYDAMRAFIAAFHNAGPEQTVE